MAGISMATINHIVNISNKISTHPTKCPINVPLKALT